MSAVCTHMMTNHMSAADALDEPCCTAHAAQDDKHACRPHTIIQPAVSADMMDKECVRRRSACIPCLYQGRAKPRAAQQAACVVNAFSGLAARHSDD
eukprot:1143893-Pelagomonas_calceolata.AAC.11